MDVRDFFLEQLENEAASVRKTIERVPEGKNDWRPHPKSMPLGYLAALVATMPGWLAFMIERDQISFDDPADTGFRTHAVETRAELLRMAEDAVEQARTALRNTTEEHLHKTWRFIAGGQTVAEGPRYAMIRDSALSHLAHHRGQLTVYLRLLETAVPAIYGPSADEPF